MMLGWVDMGVLLGQSVYGSNTHSKDRKSTRLNSSHLVISYAVFCLKKKNYSPSLICLMSIHFLPSTCAVSAHRRILPHLRPAAIPFFHPHPAVTILLRVTRYLSHTL